eukprot:TRINITY_DN14810_c0_g1_i1.p1 TRINITY_DN14810_c0_g1~~TRINITY_DN14810_c0_g1_i1.p1  ORF type:complete len:522 (-),score=95.29 TRINITY_DN14810_c0_g1_i1:270-1604(-)
MEICLPCLLFSAVLPNASPFLLREGWPLLLWPLVYVPVGAALGVTCCLAVGIPSRYVGSAAACAAFPNINGFPVAVISALGSSIPNAPSGISPMTFLSLIQLTDGIIKYTVGPMVFRRDLRAAQRRRISDHEVHPLPLGLSLRSIAVTPPVLGCGKTLDSTSIEGEKDCRTGLEEFGLQLEQVRVVEPEWSRFDSCKFWLQRPFMGPATQRASIHEALLPAAQATRFDSGSSECAAATADFLRQLLPPQVLAVLAALVIGVGPSWSKALFVPTERADGVVASPPLHLLVDVARQLGGGFVPLQMIALGGRLVNVASGTGPLAAGGAAGPRGRSRLLRIAGAVSLARMIIAPAALYGLLMFVFRPLLKSQTQDGGDRSLAFWVPPLVVAAMPTANNMSTMADLVGSGRSISAASTAMQLLASPVVLTLSLAVLIVGAQESLEQAS